MMTSVLVQAIWLFAASHAAASDAEHSALPARDGVRYVYLIRHGEYDHDDKSDSRNGKHLVALGHEQAGFAGQRLALLSASIGMFVSSQYTRARETADDIGRFIDRTPARDTLLNECTPDSESTEKDSTAAKTAKCDAQVAAAWSKYMTPSPENDAVDVLVCHGNVIRWLVSRALGTQGSLWRKMDIGNASITVVAIKADGTTKLATFSDVGHIPVAKQTWTGNGPGWQPGMTADK